MAEAAALYSARVMHRRVKPAYRFVYRVFYLLLDIDRVDEGLSPLRLLSHNRFNWFSFHERDFGPGRDRPLRGWLEGLLREHGIELDGGRVRLLCMPRVLGYVFNPISIFYCEHADGGLRAILCQVNNTFGERHYYLLADGGRPMAYEMAHSADKVFHVSPFIGMSARYRFRFTRPCDRLSLVIREARDEHVFLTAALSGQRTRLDDRTLLAHGLGRPLMTLKVIAAIHWQALKIWFRGGRFHRKPPPPQKEVS